LKDREGMNRRAGESELKIVGVHSFSVS
jgi:hypothetical protein